MTRGSLLAGCRNNDRPTACRASFESGQISMPREFTELGACLAANDCSVFDVEYNPQVRSASKLHKPCRSR